MILREHILRALIIGSVWMLPSCLSYNRPDLSSSLAYELRNGSSAPITLDFYNQGEPKTVYAEVWNGNFVTDLTSDNMRKPVDELWSGSSLTLGAGETALLYEASTYNNSAYCLFTAGSGTGLHLFSYVTRIFGDSVIMSRQGFPDEELQINQNGKWETWYNETNFIYYHLLTVE